MPTPYVPASGLTPAVPATTYAQFSLGAGERSGVEEYGNYAYTAYHAEGGLATFYFAMNRTTAQRNTPYRTFTWFGDHSWPPILLDIDFPRDPHFPVATVTNNGSGQGVTNAAGLSVRYVYIPSVQEGTEFIQEEFTSEIPFTIGRYPVPMPQPVQRTIPSLGLKIDFPECLHKDLELVNLQTAFTSVYGNSVASVFGSVEGQVFKKTNFPRWMAYVKSWKPEPPGILWTATRIRVVPPNQPRPIILG